MKFRPFFAVLALLVAGQVQAQTAAPVPGPGHLGQYIVELAPGVGRGGESRQTALGLVGSVGGGELVQVYGLAVRLPAGAAGG